MVVVIVVVIGVVVAVVVVAVVVAVVEGQGQPGRCHIISLLAFAEKAGDKARGDWARHFAKSLLKTLKLVIVML